MNFKLILFHLSSFFAFLSILFISISLGIFIEITYDIIFYIIKFFNDTNYNINSIFFNYFLFFQEFYNNISLIKNTNNSFKFQSILRYLEPYPFESVVLFITCILSIFFALLSYYLSKKGGYDGKQFILNNNLNSKIHEKLIKQKNLKENNNNNINRMNNALNLNNNTSIYNDNINEYINKITKINWKKRCKISVSKIDLLIEEIEAIKRNDLASKLYDSLMDARLAFVNDFQLISVDLMNFVEDLFKKFNKIIKNEKNIIIKEKRTINKILKASLNRLFNFLKEDYICILIYECENEIAKLLYEFENEEPWTFHSSHKDYGIEVKTSIKNEERSDLISFKVEGIIKSDLFSVLATFYEHDLYTEWLPACSSSKKIADISRFRMILDLKFPLWWPFKDRRLIACGYGDVLPDGDIVLIYIKSLSKKESEDIIEDVLYERSIISKDIYNQKIPDVLPNINQIRYNMKKDIFDPGDETFIDCFGGFYLRRIDETHTEIKTILNIDVKLKVVPSSIINWVLKHFSHYLLPMLRKQAKKFKPTGELYHRIHENPRIYNEIDERLNGIN